VELRILTTIGGAPGRGFGRTEELLVPVVINLMPPGIRYLWLCSVEVFFGLMPQGMGCWFPGHFFIASGLFWLMINHSAVFERPLLEITVLWPHLMRDVLDVPPLQGRTGIRTH